VGWGFRLLSIEGRKGSGIHSNDENRAREGRGITSSTIGRKKKESNE
jgi:hypothetical protein